MVATKQTIIINGDSAIITHFIQNENTKSVAFTLNCTGSNILLKTKKHSNYGSKQ